MIKVDDVDGLPVDEVMTLQTIGSKSGFMRILMAIRASRSDAQECLTEISYLDECEFTAVDMFGGVAALTGNPNMLSFELVSGLSVIKSVDIPFC